MWAGFFVFIGILLAILGTIPGAAPQAPGGWPPHFPSYSAWNPGGTSAPDCDMVTLCVNVLAYWIGAFFGVIIGGIVFLGGIVVFVISIFTGLVSLALPGLPPELSFINTVLGIALIVVIALFLFRLIRSVIPFVSGNEGAA